MQTIAARMKISEQIGNYKRDNKVTILQVSRWEEIIETRIAQGNAMGLSDEFVTNLLKLVHHESIQVQQKVMNKEAQKV
jgi:chorismate mutase